MTGSWELPHRQRNQAFAVIAGTCVAALGCLTLAGWVFHIETLKCLIPGSAPLKPNIALGFLLCGSALALLSCGKIDRWPRCSITLLAVLVISLAVVTLGEIFFGWDLGIDQLLVRTDSPGASNSLRMFPATALCFLLAGGAILAGAQLRGKRLRIPFIAGLGAALVVVGVLALSGFFFEILLGPRWNVMGMNISGVSASVGFTLIGGGSLSLLQSKRELTWSLDHLTTAGFILGLLLMIGAAAVAFNFTKQTLGTRERLSHRQETLKEIEEVVTGITDLLSSERIYVITGDQRLLEGREQTRGDLQEDVSAVRELTGNDPKQQRRLDQLEPLIEELIRWEEQVIAARREEGLSAAAETVSMGTGIKISGEIVDLLDGMWNEEYGALDLDRKEAQSASSAPFLILPLGFLLSLAILSLGVFFLNSGLGERAEAESALKHAEEKYRSIFENAAEGIFQSTPEGKYISVNPALTRMFGYGTPEELIASVGDIGSFIYVNPDHRTHFKQLIAEQGFVERFEYEVYRKNRSRVWLSENARAVRDTSGAITYYEGTIQDITERKRAEDAVKQAEEKYRNIVENAVEGVFQTTPDGRFMTANLAFARILGFDSVDELIDERADIARDNYVDPRSREEFKRLLEKNGFVLNYELETYRKDRSKVWLSENVRAVRDEKGAIVYYEGTSEDITKRKRAEEALRASEAQLQTIVENLDEGVVVSDLNGGLLHWNRAALDIHGFTDLAEGLRFLTDFVDTFALSDMDGRPLPAEKWPLARILRGEDLHDLELRVRNIKANWERIFNYGGTLVHDANRQPLMAIVTMSDITERKRAEERLHEQADIINRAHDAIVIRNFDDLKILFWNKGAERLYGWTAEERVGLSEVTACADPRQVEAVMSSLHATGEFQGDLKLITKDGKESFANVRETLIRDADGTPRSILIICTDITERKRAEERLHEQADIINRAQDAVVIRKFEDNRITFWNTGAERLYGWSAAEAIGRTMRELIFAGSNEGELSIEHLVSTGEFHGEMKHRARDRRELIVDSRVTLIRNDDGTPRSVLSISTDVTEQKKLQTQLLRGQRLESIGTLAGGVAHDLNNILTPILTCAETLRTELGEEDRQSAIALIEESARRGAVVVKQVLTFARGVEGERVIINPRHLIEEMVDIARRTFSKAIQVASRYPENVWSIQGDPTQLHQVLLNLCVNARDAMPNGGSLTLAAENVDIDENYASMTPGADIGQYVLLQVSDTGSGIPQAVIDKIFDPFFTTKEIGKGTGLGLSTTLGIVKSHGGFISVYSNIGTGTIFKVFLSAQASDQPQKPEATLDLLNGHGELILVVDDEPNILSVTKMILEKHNYGILNAHDGPEALTLIAQQGDAIKAVLTDISMPYMDGVALIRTVKKMKPDSKFIASTGQGEEMRIAELKNLGVTNFLTKPYDTGKLLKTIGDALEPKTEATA